MKLYKKRMLLFLLYLATVSLCSCSADKDMKEDFVDYYGEQLSDYIFSTSSNTEIVIGSLYKEENSSNKKVVLSIYIGGNSNVESKTYKWLQLSPEDRKTELKECGDMVLEYAQDKNWSNDFYLYINASNIYDGCSIVYDYEKDEIWIPDCENTFLEMYQKFGTFYKRELEENQEGIDFLIKNDLAYMKHNQVEYGNNLSYTVYVSDGKFNSYGKENSVKY